MPAAGEAGPPPSPSRIGRHRPVGWRCLRTTVIGGPAERRLRVHAVLLHPAHGIALIDLAPRSTPRAVATLRRSLAGQGLRASAVSEIPIVYLCVTPEELRVLPRLLRAAIIRQAEAEAAGRPDRRWVVEVEAALVALDGGSTDAAPPRTGGRVLLLSALAAGGLFAALLGDGLWAPAPAPAGRADAPPAGAAWPPQAASEPGGVAPGATAQRQAARQAPDAAPGAEAARPAAGPADAGASSPAPPPLAALVPVPPPVPRPGPAVEGGSVPLPPPMITPAEAGEAAAPAGPATPDLPVAPPPPGPAPVQPPDAVLAAAPPPGSDAAIPRPQPPGPPIPPPGRPPEAGGAAPAVPLSPSAVVVMPDQGPAALPERAGEPEPPAAGPAPPHLAAIAPEPAPPEPAAASRQPTSSAAPARPPASPRCGLLLARLQLGERPSDADRALLRSACAPAS